MAGTEVTFSGVQALTKVNLQGDTIALSVKKSDFRVSAPAFRNLSGQVSGLMRYERGRVEIESLDLSSHDMKFGLSGSAGPLPDRTLDFTLEARSGPRTLSMFSRLFKQLKKETKAYVEAKASIKGTFSNPVVDGRIRCSGISFQGIQLTDAALVFQYRDKQALLSGEQWKLERNGKNLTIASVRSVLNYSSRGVDIQQLEIKAGDLSASVSGRADPQTGFNSLIAVASTGKGESLSFLASTNLEGEIDVQGSLTGGLDHAAL